MSSTHVTVARARHGASVARGARALEGSRGKIARGRAARGILVVRAAGDKEDTEVEAKARVGYSAARKRSPKPLPSTFGDAGKGKVKGFEDPFERAKSSAGSKPPAASPFDMPASALDASAPRRVLVGRRPARSSVCSPTGYGLGEMVCLTVLTMPCNESRSNAPLADALCELVSSVGIDDGALLSSAVPLGSTGVAVKPMSTTAAIRSPMATLPRT